MIQTVTKLMEKHFISSSVVAFTLQSEYIAQNAKPGQFIDIRIENCTLRRPFSICEILQNKIKICFQIKGKGTQIMASWPVGKQIDVLGPLGNGFATLHPNDNVLIVGGGIGCFALLELTKKCYSCHVILGFKSKNEVVLNEEFAKYAKSVEIYTQDGSFANKGLPTDCIIEFIQNKKINRIASCGPTPLMKAVFEQTKLLNNDIMCEVCLEEKMACGIGACLGCQCKIKQPNGEIKSKHVCCDGPVFEAKEVFFS